MLKIKILRKMEYGDTFIYIRQFEYIFEYLFFCKGQIYQNHIISVPRMKERILWRLGLIESPYSKDEIEQAEQVILSGAMESMDVLKGIK